MIRVSHVHCRPSLQPPATVPSIRIHRHPECARCARIARMHDRFDLLGRVETTTETPPTGPLRMGEIVVEDCATGHIAHGLDAFRLIVAAIPFYAPARLLLLSPRMRDRIVRDLAGCDDGACAVPE